MTNGESAVLLPEVVYGTFTEDADMRNAIVVIVGALSLLACSKNKAAEDTTTTRGAASEPPTMVSVEEIRTALLEKRPSSSDAINSLMISNDSGVVTLRGRVEDEATHADLINRVRSMPNVRGVRDELQVMPRAAATPAPMDTSGTTTTTGANQQPGMGQGGTTGSGMGGTQGQGQMGGTQGQGQTGGTQGQGQMGGTQGQGQTGGGSMGQGQTGGGSMGAGQTGSTARTDAVRQAMMKARPKSQTLIQGLTITDDGNVVIVSGTVPDEATHQALLKAAKDAPGVKNVQDDIKVQKKQQ
jgi:osmotically-inducible protein OsmY